MREQNLKLQRKVQDMEIDKVRKNWRCVIIPNEIIPNEIIPNKIIPNEIILNKIILNETIPKEIIPKEIIPNEIIPNEIIPNETFLNQILTKLAFQNVEKSWKVIWGDGSQDTGRDGISGKCHFGIIT